MHCYNKLFSPAVFLTRCVNLLDRCIVQFFVQFAHSVQCTLRIRLLPRKSDIVYDALNRWKRLRKNRSCCVAFQEKLRRPLIDKRISIGPVHVGLARGNGVLYLA